MLIPSPDFWRNGKRTMSKDIADCFVTDERFPKEFDVRFSERDGFARVRSDFKQHMENLWENPDVEPQQITIKVEEDMREYRMVEPEEHNGEDVVTVYAEGPKDIVNSLEE